jgi:serine/threonine protein kinase
LIKANNTDLKKIPEAWAWMTFSALVECGLAMETDASTEDRTPTQIVHRDLKPANVYLDLATEKS